MKTTYKILIACILTAIVTAFTTTYVINHKDDIVKKLNTFAYDPTNCKPDANGCCAGETYTDMGSAGWNCCPNSGGDCFPPIVK